MRMPREQRTGAACESGCERRSRAGLLVFSVMALLLGASPCILESWAGGADGGDVNTALANSEMSGLAVWEADLEGLHCPTCVPGLRRAFLREEGVRSAEVSYDPQRAIVCYDPESMASDTFRAIFEEFGYRVVGDGSEDGNKR